MIPTLALLGFLALIFLLAYRIGLACGGHNHIRRQRQPEIPPEECEPLVSLRQV